MLDLATTLHTMGFRVTIAVANGAVRRLIKVIAGRSPRIPIPARQIVTLPLRFIAESQRPVYGVAGSALRQLEDGERRFRRELQRADVVVDGGMLFHQSLTGLRQQSNARYILNHAGSPLHISESWADAGKYPAGIDARCGYRDFCGKYDAVLFQAPDQIQEYHDVIGKTTDHAKLVRPSCNESTVLAAGRQPSPYREGRIPIVLVGTIQPRKQQVVAIKAFERIAQEFPHAELHIVGGVSNEPYARTVKRTIQSSEAEDRIHIHGHRNDYLMYMAHARILLQSSKSEGVSRVLREAMLLRLPIVSFAISGTTGTLQAHTHAFLADPDDTSGLADQLALALRRDEDRAKRAQAAFEQYLLGHSYAAYASSVLSLMDSLLPTTEPLPQILA